MHIKEVSEALGLTRKAITYYEEKGLLHVPVSSNGYRNYGTRELQILKEITVLRSLGLTVQTIGAMLRGGDKSALLEMHRKQNEEKISALHADQERLAALIANYDMEQAFERLRKHPAHTLREKLSLAFPGPFGLFMAHHFGPFLTAPIDTPEKEEAFRAILAYLDDVPLSLPEALADALSEAASPLMENPQTLQGIQAAMAQALQEPDTYIQENRQAIASYLAYRQSQDFAASPAGWLQREMAAFQRESGYTDIWVHHMKVISPDYAAHIHQLEKANQAFLAHFPMAEDREG